MFWNDCKHLICWNFLKAILIFSIASGFIRCPLFAYNKVRNTVRMMSLVKRDYTHFRPDFKWDWLVMGRVVLDRALTSQEKLWGYSTLGNLVLVWDLLRLCKVVAHDSYFTYGWHLWSSLVMHFIGFLVIGSLDTLGNRRVFEPWCNWIGSCVHTSGLWYLWLKVFWVNRSIRLLVHRSFLRKFQRRLVNLSLHRQSRALNWNSKTIYLFSYLRSSVLRTLRVRKPIDLMLVFRLLNARRTRNLNAKWIF